MGSKKPSRRKRELEEKLRRLADEGEWLFDFQREDDRAGAVLGAAFLDVSLEALLRDYCVDNFDVIDPLLRGDMPLGAFKTRARVAYLLGLLPRIALEDLLTIANVRNRFAHGLQGLSFDDEEVTGLCKKLQTPKAMPELVELSYSTTPRFLFTTAAVIVQGEISAAKRRVKEAGRRTVPEPQPGLEDIELKNIE